MHNIENSKNYKFPFFHVSIFSCDGQAGESIICVFYASFYVAWFRLAFEKRDIVQMTIALVVCS